MDFEEMGARLGLEKDEFMELVFIFVSSAEEDLQKLDSGLAANDAKVASEAAHSLKGSSGNLGFADISAMAATIEQSSRKGEISGLESLSGKISSEIEKIKNLIS